MRNVSVALLATMLLSVNLSADALRDEDQGQHGNSSVFRPSESLAVSLRNLAHASSEPDGAIDKPVSVGTSSELLPNGDFEMGTDFWVMGSSNGWPLILEAGALGLTPHSGSWAAWLGGAPDEISVIEQMVTVPRDAPVLKYWHWISSDDECGFDVAGVVVNVDTAVDVYWLCTDDNTGGWALHSVDLSAYAGHAILLSIVVDTDGLFDSSLYVDDVFLEFDGDGPIALFTDGFESGDTSAW